ncbi:MAG: hypothetical protein WBC44_11640 [Planctomycetaceae bacterium]
MVKVLMRNGKVVLRPSGAVMLIGDEADPCTAPCSCIPTQVCSSLIMPYAWTLVIPDDWSPEFGSEFSISELCRNASLTGTHDLYRAEYVASYHSCGTKFVSRTFAQQGCRWFNVDTTQTVEAIVEEFGGTPCTAGDPRICYESPYDFTHLRSDATNCFDPDSCESRLGQDALSAGSPGSIKIIAGGGLGLTCSLSHSVLRYRNVSFFCEPDTFLSNVYSVTYQSDAFPEGTDLSQLESVTLTQTADPNSPSEITMIPAEIAEPS